MNPAILGVIAGGKRRSSGDPEWANVLLLLTGDSVNDKSSYARGTPTTVSCSSTGTVIRMLTAADGGDNSAGLSFPPNANWSLGTAPFTYEIELQVTRVPNGQTSLGSVWTQGGGTGGIWITYYTGSQLETYTDSGVILRESAAVSLSTAMTHVAWVRDTDNTSYLYVNGVMVDSTASMTSNLNSSTQPFDIGDFASGLGMTADINYARLTANTCRYPGGATFTPPTLAEILDSIP